MSKPCLFPPLSLPLHSISGWTLIIYLGNIFMKSGLSTLVNVFGCILETQRLLGHTLNLISSCFRRVSRSRRSRSYDIPIPTRYRHAKSNNIILPGDAGEFAVCSLPEWARRRRVAPQPSQHHTHLCIIGSHTVYFYYQSMLALYGRRLYEGAHTVSRKILNKIYEWRCSLGVVHTGIDWAGKRERGERRRDNKLPLVQANL